MSKGKYTLRFNLGRGNNFMKWKLTSPNGEANYYSPDDYYFILSGNCRLRNQKNSANKIFNGQHKVVCAWIEFDEVEILNQEPNHSYSDEVMIMYNPRILPHWRNHDMNNLDNHIYDKLVTKSNKIFKVN